MLGLWRTGCKIIAHIFRPKREWPAFAPQVVEETWLDRSFETRYKEVIDGIRTLEGVCSCFYIEDALVGIESAPWLDGLDGAQCCDLYRLPSERTPESVERWYRDNFATFAWNALDLIEKEYGEMMRFLSQSSLMPGYDTGVWRTRRIEMTSEIHKCFFCLKVRIASIQLGLRMNPRARILSAPAHVIHRLGERAALKLVEDLDVLRVVIFHGIVGADIPDATVNPGTSPFYRDFPRGHA